MIQHTINKENARYFRITSSLTLNNGKIIRRGAKSFGRAINFIKNNDWKKARIKIEYGWGDNYGEYTNKKDALLFMRCCREDYMYFKEEACQKVFG